MKNSIPSESREKELLCGLCFSISVILRVVLYKKRRKLGALNKCFLSLFIKYVGFWRSFRFPDYFPNILRNLLPYFIPVPVPKCLEQYFQFPFPFLNVGNSISNSRSRSRMLGTVFLIPVPVPKYTKVIPAHA